MASVINPRIPEFRSWPAARVDRGDVMTLVRFLEAHPRTLVLSGAGCSTDSGIPAYRDAHGRWTRRQPIQYQAFMSSESTRRRYWARSYLGWPRMQAARPNPAHRALAELQSAGLLGGLVTQNVDGLHQRAGSSDVVELHGTLSRVLCQHCGLKLGRDALQSELNACNPGWQARVEGINPDGDAELDEAAHRGFNFIDCPECSGILKPDVVFFGENVPAQRVERVRALLGDCDALLIVGSSLAVWSGFRFAREAALAGLPVVAVNQGRTRADDLLRFKVEASCHQVLATVGERLAAPKVFGKDR
ncbi:NAD-dependent protein deacetylase [Gammaproteobacteria bacterium AB-CW1]|uniref:NAD-dependent protein deacetylase n=1 Tax=Natronospira elongata TaxID=3110268 RepID=A0AAP6JDT2_9GAMM|nr:NAD-dependent protein deacetylase [Gammaproteobacteria bacterium AB-CW1]